MYMDNKGSALAWVLMLLIVSSILLLCILPLGVNSIQESRENNNKQQAFYTAKSVADMVVSYIVSDTAEKQQEEGAIGYQIVKKAREASMREGYTWQVQGLNEAQETDMGNCQVNARYDGQFLYITAKAVCGTGASSVRVKLQQDGVGSEYLEANEYITGAYPGIRVNHMNASQSGDGGDGTNEGQLKVEESSRLLVLDEGEGITPEAAAESAKYDLKVNTFPSAQLVNVSKIPGKVWRIDERGSENAVAVYQFQNDFSLKELILDSYGDTYVWIGKNTVLTVDNIGTNSYYSNLFFVLDENAVLKLNEEGKEKNMRLWVCSLNKNNGAKVELGDSLHLSGVVDVDEMVTGSNVSYSHCFAYGMSGSYGKTENRWRVTAYESGEGGGTDGQ